MEQVHPDDREGARDMWVHSLKTGSDFVRQLRFVRSDHETLWLDIHARVVMLSQGGHSLGLVGVVKDITERRQQEALQRWEAEHDPLTGLLNRRGFERRLEEAFADFQKTSTPSALLLFDLDHFKPINDEGGHALLLDVDVDGVGPDAKLPLSTKYASDALRLPGIGGYSRAEYQQDFL